MINDKSNILNAWITVEQLSEGDIKKNSKEYTQIETSQDYQQFFSQFLSRQKAKKNSGFAIYCGIFPFQEVVDTLRSSYHLAPTNEDLVTSDKFTFALYFNKDFDFLTNHFFLTMSGYIRTEGRVPERFYEIEEQIGQWCANQFEELGFHQALEKVFQKYNIEPDDCRIKFIDNLDTADTNLHSFFITDLEKAKASLTPNLERYFGKAVEQRINLDSRKTSSAFNKQVLGDILQPLCYPLGRFPSKPDYALSFMQQVAINTTLNDKDTIRSVNGPPGTGKTTLLKDIFAEFIVEQAKIISGYSNPELKGSLVYSEPYKLAPLPENITSKGIVVASSNNGAVQNIVNELPRIDKVEEPEFIKQLLEVDYFTSVVNSEHDSKHTDNAIKNWGCISAEGGNSVNLGKMKSLLEGILAELKSESFESDRAIYVEFNQLYESLFTKRRLIQDIADHYKQLQKLRDEKQALESSFSQDKANKKEQLTEIIKKIDEKDCGLAKEQQSVEQGLDELSHRQEVLESKIQIAKQDDFVLRETKPTFLWLKKLFSFPEVIEYYASLKQSNEKISSFSSQLLSLKNEERQLTLRRSDIIQERNKISTDRESKQTEYQKWFNNSSNTLSSYSVQIKQLEEKVSQSSIQDIDFSLEYDELQLSNPWFDKDYRFQQSKLFIQALAVRKQFLYDNRKHFEKALWIWFDPNKYIHRKNGEELIQASWDWINFAIPVISTTFASFGRMFSRLGEGGIANLFIDEAGQALPQASVGAIMRSKRVMAVGDPSQIQPVLTLDSNILGMLAKYYSVSDDFLSNTASTQSLIDSTSRYGFEKPDGNWIGIPLWVHRRCKNPMFSISNKISYDNLMVQGIPSRGRGEWINISGTAKDKYVKQQGEYLIDELKRREEDWNDIFIITPFKHVAGQLSILLKGIGFTKYVSGKPSNVGTVHTFQGKEAKIVYFVLGADSSSKGAAKWAVSQPNIMNVAATRAKEEFYIIGDKSLYQSLQSPIIKDTLDILNRKSN